MKRMHHATGIVMLAALLAAGAAQAADVAVRIDAEKGIAIEAQGHVFVSGFVPALRQATLETRTLEKGTFRYTFADADLSGSRVEPLPGGRGIDVVYGWGSVRCAVTARADGADIDVTVTNRGDRTVADFDLALLEVGFPAKPEGETKLTSNRDSPGVARVRWEGAGGGRSLVAAILTPDPLQIGFVNAGGKAPQSRLLALRGGVRTFAPGAVEMLPLGQPRIEPGAAMTFRITLRFAAGDAPDPAVLADLYEAFRAWHPPVTAWHDRRPIGAIFFPSRGRISPTNPRGWFNDPKIDITTPEGLKDLKKRFLQAARAAVGVLNGIGAQGAVVWNLEGEENPHPISYIGDPRLQAVLAPELNGCIDDYFRVFREAGLRTGVTLRPTQPYARDDGSWHHGTGSHMEGRNPLNDGFDALRPEGLAQWRYFPIVERMSRKIAFAQARWGCTLFYVDTNGIHVPVGADQKFEWMLLDPWVWRELRRRHPDVLLIPEFARGPACFAAVAPYDQLDHTKRTSTPEHVRQLYPEAFVANYIVNSPRERLAKGEPWFDALVDAVAHGDTVIHRGWFGCAVNNDVRAIFAEAARRAPFEVFVAAEGLALNGEAVDGPAGLTQVLRARTAPGAAVSARRVYVGYELGVDWKARLDPVFEAVGAAGCFIAWSQPLRREQTVD